MDIDKSSEICPGCGILLPDQRGPVHPYMTGSVSCWNGFGELLSAQYGDPGRMRFNQLVVDAYAAQHPGGGEDPRQVQSVGVHLMTLALFIDHGVDPARGSGLHRRMVRRATFHRLDPSSVARDAWLTFQHVPLRGPADLARDRAFEWAESVWRAWEPHHATVGQWLTSAGLSNASNGG